MTIRYLEWLAKVSSGEFDLQNASMNVRLVADVYIPNENDTAADVTPYILAGVNVIVDNYFRLNPMSNILDEVMSKMVLGIQSFPDVIQKEIDRVFTGEKAEKLKQLVMNPTDNFQFWNDLKEAGIKYFVFESTNYNCLTFCEDI